MSDWNERKEELKWRIKFLNWVETGSLSPEHIFVSKEDKQDNDRKMREWINELKGDVARISKRRKTYEDKDVSEIKAGGQHDLILNYIEEHGSITPMDAFNDLGITKLATRISELKKMGANIGQAYEESCNRRGEIVRYMRYWIKKEDADEEQGCLEV